MIDRQIKTDLAADPAEAEVHADAAEEAGAPEMMRESARAAARRYELGARWLRWTDKARAREMLGLAARAYRRGRSYARAAKCALGAAS